MDFLRKNQKMIFALVLFVGAFYVYNNFFALPEESPQDVSTTAVGSEVLKLYNSLQAVELDEKLFASPLYQELTDFSASVPIQVPGRLNPFDLIGR